MSNVTNTLQRIQVDPTTPSAPVYAFFEKKTIVDEQVFVAPWTSVIWPMDSKKTVTLDGKTMTYAEVSAFALAIAEQENAEQSAADAAAKASAIL